MKKAIQRYYQGAITQQGFCAFVTTIAAREEIEEFVQLCPAELMAVLKEYLANHVPDESKWPRTFSIACYAPWATAEEIMESQRREQEQIWNGVRLLKAHLP
jgi:hypothetical protein